MTRYILIETATGRLLSETDQLDRIADPLPGGVEVRELAARPLDTETWDEARRTFVSRPANVMVDRLDDLRADPAFQAVWNKLSTQERVRFGSMFSRWLGPMRYRGEGAPPFLGLPPMAGGAEWTVREGAGRLSTVGQVSSRGTLLTSGGANTKGAYSQLSASTPIEAHGLGIWLNNTSLDAKDALVDIAVGAAGSEQIIAANLALSAPFPAGLQGAAFFPYILPLHVPAGTRLAARCQTNPDAYVAIDVTLFAHPDLSSTPLSRLTTYGAATGDSGGTSIDPGGSANTKGAYAQLTASTTSDIHAIFLAFGNQLNDARGTAYTWVVDIAIGAAGSEVVKVADIAALATSAALAALSTGVLGPLPCYIPAGTRIAARAQCNGTDATDRLFDLILYGIG